MRRSSASAKQQTGGQAERRRAKSTVLMKLENGPAKLGQCSPGAIDQILRVQELGSEAGRDLRKMMAKPDRSGTGSLRQSLGELVVAQLAGGVSCPVAGGCGLGCRAFSR